MLVINIKDGEPIERALKRYKNKVRDTKQIQQLRKRKHYEKPSVARKAQRSKAVHKETKQQESNNG